MKVMKTDKTTEKKVIITLRVSEEQNEYLQRVGEIIEAQTGQNADRTWVIKQLMKFGQDAFEAKYGIKTKKK